MDGGDLEITANATKDYAVQKYGLTATDIDLILKGQKLVRRYDRNTQRYEEAPV